jgi:hypothetical protein
MAYNTRMLILTELSGIESLVTTYHLLLRLFKAEQPARALLGNVYPVEAVLNRTAVVHPNRGRERELLAQLGRVNGAGKEVMHLASLVKRKRIPRQLAGVLP